MASHYLTTKKYLRFLGVNDPSLFFSDEELTWINHWLNGEEEINHPEIDWPNFEITDKIKTDYKKPFVDLFVRSRLQEKNFTPENLWPEKADFAVCLSHDIDRWESYSPKVFVRNLKKRRFHSPSVRSFQKLTLQIFKTRIKQQFTRKNSDPLWCYEKWIELEKKYARTGTYFVFIRPKELHNLHEHDCDYTLEDEVIYQGNLTNVKSILKDWSKSGVEIGLHGSIHTENNSTLFRDLKTDLMTAVKQPIQIARQHYLSFKLPETLRVLGSNGITVDSSIGFNKFNGFRLGTSMPVFLNQQQTEILEIPLIIMDSSMFLQRKLTTEAAQNEIDDIIEQVRSVNGCLTINFHPDYVDQPHFFETYEYLLNSLSRHKCVFMNMSEIKKHLDKQCAE